MCKATLVTMCHLSLSFPIRPAAQSAELMSACLVLAPTACWTEAVGPDYNASAAS